MYPSISWAVTKQERDACASCCKRPRERIGCSKGALWALPSVAPPSLWLASKLPSCREAGAGAWVLWVL